MSRHQSFARNQTVVAVRYRGIAAALPRLQIPLLRVAGKKVLVVGDLVIHPAGEELIVAGLVEHAFIGAIELMARRGVDRK